MRALATVGPMLLRAGGPSGGRQHLRTTGLAVLAFAITTALALSTLGGLHAFQTRAATSSAFQDFYGDTYVQYAWIAVTLLMVPLISLGGAAARLGVSRRDARLATLRLLGATPREVVVLTVVETAWQGLVGAMIGVVGYIVLLPVWTLVPFQGGHLSLSELWVGPQVLLPPVVVPVLAAMSAGSTLRRVVVSPLGVAQRTTPAGLRVVRVIVMGIAVLGFFVAASMRGGEEATIVLVIVGMLAAVLGSLNLVGPWLIGRFGKALVQRAQTAPTLLAARRLVDDPKGAWRIVGGLALASFLAAILSIIPMLDRMERMDPHEQIFNQDLVTGGLLTLVITFVVAACSAGITQAAAVLDRRREYALQTLAGVPVELLDAVRRREALLPLVFVSGASAGLGLLMIVPFLGGLALAPSGLLLLGVCLGLGGLLVYAASEVSGPLLRTVLSETSVRPD